MNRLQAISSSAIPTARRSLSAGRCSETGFSVASLGRSRTAGESLTLQACSYGFVHEMHMHAFVWTDPIELVCEEKMNKVAQ